MNLMSFPRVPVTASLVVLLFAGTTLAASSSAGDVSTEHTYDPDAREAEQPAPRGHLGKGEAAAVVTTSGLAASSVIMGASLPVAVIATTVPHVIVPLIGHYEVGRFVSWEMVPPVLAGVTGMSLSSVAITSLLVAFSVTAAAGYAGGLKAATAALLGSIPGLIQSVGGTALVAFSAYMYWGAAFYHWAAPPMLPGRGYAAVVPQPQLTPLSAATLSLGVALCLTAPAVTAAGGMATGALASATSDVE